MTGNTSLIVGRFGVALLGFILTHMPCALGAQAMGVRPTLSVRVPEEFQRGLEELRQSCDVQAWPHTEILRVSPPTGEIGRGLLLGAELDDQESRVLPKLGPFTDEAWVGCQGTWNWSHHIVDPAASSLELPPDDKAALLDSLRPDELDDPNLVQEILDKARDRYRMHSARRFAGQIRIKLCVAPNSQAAYEFLMRECCISSLPISAVASEFLPSAQLEGIGTLGFGGSSPAPGRVMFVRDNIAVIIEGHGDLKSETLALAREIDSLILQQPVLSREELIARAPSVTVSATARTHPSGQKTLPFEVSAAPEHQIIGVWASAGTENVQIKDSEAILGSRVGKTTIKVSAISDELLIGTREIEVDIPAD